jgi:hypothetical protein
VSSPCLSHSPQSQPITSPIRRLAVRLESITAQHRNYYPLSHRCPPCHPTIGPACRPGKPYNCPPCRPHAQPSPSSSTPPDQPTTTTPTSHHQHHLHQNKSASLLALRNSPLALSHPKKHGPSITSKPTLAPAAPAPAAHYVTPATPYPKTSAS